MSDLISRQDVINAVLVSNFSACTVYGRSEEGMATAKELIQAIKNLPSVEPEIIRCKDCEHWDTSWENDYAPNYHYCPLVDGTHRGDFYCADAERIGKQNG